MPRAPKPQDMRQNTEREDLGDVPQGELEHVEAPRALRSWLAPTKRSWERYFASPARHVTVASLDLDTLERLWTLYDERARAQRELQRPQRDEAGKITRSDSRMVEGSQGQMRPSGFYQVIARLDGEIRQLEDRVAKSMKSRLILGLRVRGDDADTDEPDSDDAAAGDGETDDRADDIPRDPRLYVVDRQAG